MDAVPRGVTVDPIDVRVLDAPGTDAGLAALAALPRDADGLPLDPVVLVLDAPDPAVLPSLLEAGAGDVLDRAGATATGLALARARAAARLARQRERAAHERRLRDLEARYAAFVDAVPQLVWTAAPDGANDYVNRHWTEYTGQPASEAAGQGWMDTVHPEDRAWTAVGWAAAQEQGGLYESEHRMRGRDGEYRMFLARALPLRDESGRIVRWFGTSTDIEANRRLQAELARSRERLELAHAAVGVGTWEWDPERRVARWSREMYALLGIPPEDVDHQETWRGRVHPDDRRRGEALAAQALAGEIVEEEYRYAHPERGERWMYSKARLMDTVGAGRIVYGVCFDVTERKRLEEELRDADRRKDQFLAMLAHELRNPLAPLRASVDVLRRTVPDSAAGRPALEIIGRQTAQLARLVDDLLDVSRITHGRIELRPETVEIDAVVAAAIEAVQPLLTARRHALAVHGAGPTARVVGDRARLTQVIGNLLTNAAKYTDAGGRIAVEAAVEGDEVVVTVTDDGIGIAPELLPHVFELFVQSDRALDRAEGGLGIGLSLVRQLVEMHRGRVEAHSAGTGRGARFRVRLPRAAPGAHAAAVPVKAAAAAPSPRRVLVVDDNRDSADSLAVWLRLDGHEVDVAYDARVALRLARELAPHTVLLDIGLPEIDGYEVARRLRAEPATAALRLVALTGYGQPEDRRRALAAGFDAHLTKPVDPDALAALLAAPRESRVAS